MKKMKTLTEVQMNKRPRPRGGTRASVVVCALFLLASCGAGDDDTPAGKNGEGGVVVDEERERATRDASAPGDAPVGWLEGEDAAKFASDPWRLGHVIPPGNVLLAYDDQTVGYDREGDPFPQEDWVLFRTGGNDPHEVAKAISDMWDGNPLPRKGGRDPRANPSRLAKIYVRRSDDPPFDETPSGVKRQFYVRNLNHLARAPGGMAVNFGRPEWFVQVELLINYEYQNVFINPFNGVGIYTWLKE